MRVSAARPPSLRFACEVVAILAAVSILIFMGWRLTQMQDLVVRGQPLFGDYIAFWSAGRLALEGTPELVHDEHAIFAQHKEAIPKLNVMAPWNSPPTFLLIASALAVLPYVFSALTFMLLSWGVYIIAARKVLPDLRALIFAITMPAAIYQLGSVQIGVINAGVAALIFLWLDKRPRVAGSMVAFFAIKPHLALLWPLMLALSGRWRAFIAAAIATTAFVLIAGLVFGFESYGRFIDNLDRAQTLISHRRVATETFGSLFGNMLGAGFSREAAMIIHGVSAALAVALASFVFWRGQRETQGAALCAATLLISPYLFFYDFTLLGVGAALMGAPRNRFEIGAWVLAWSAWLTVVLNDVTGPGIPLAPTAAWLLLIAAALRVLREGNAAERLAPAPQL